MKMEVEIISKESIKPSSPTPPHKRTHKISLLDQITLSFFVPLVLYYPNLENSNSNSNSNTNTNTDEFIYQTTQILKKSLSSTLSLFYPFAGRFKDKLSIDCNDEGALLVVAKFKNRLSDFLKRPDPEGCRAHIPDDHVTHGEPSPGSDIAVFQVNYFDCGGIAIATCISHKVADAATMYSFMKAWATATAGETPLLSPDYAACSLFPRNEFMPEEAKLSFHVARQFKIGRTVMRRYVFGSPEISKLRDQLLSPESRRPSRVETVTAFLWKCYIVASNKFLTGDNNYKVNYLTHSVNLRRKADPPFPENSFGNLVWPAAMSTFNIPAHVDIKHLLTTVRSAISNVDGDFVKRMQGEEGYSGYCKNLYDDTLNHIPDNADGLNITSWCNFGFYGIDFGWGKPTWITKCDVGRNTTDVPFVNLLWLMDTRDGDGIEACLVMDQRYYAEFDKIQELTDLASVDPSPFDIYCSSQAINSIN